MHKVYLLLRNNKQSGPYTLEELTASGLKATDLIWIEGRSLSWSYPAEIEALKGHVPGSKSPVAESTPQPSNPGNSQAQQHKNYLPQDTSASSSNSSNGPKKIYVSLPAGKTKQQTPVNSTSAGEILEQKAEELRKRLQNQTPAKEIENGGSSEEALTALSLEQKAEELRKKIQSYKPAAKSTTAAVPLETKYARSLDEVEKDYALWTYKSKTSKKTGSQRIVITVAASLLLMALGFGLTKTSLLSKQRQSEEHPAEQVVKKEEAKPVEDISQMDLSGLASETPVAANETPSYPGSDERPIREVAKTTAVTSIKKPVGSKEPGKKAGPVEAKTKPVTEAAGAATVKTPEESRSDAAKQTAAVPVKTKTEETTVNQPQKRKTFGEKLNALFGKLNKASDEEETTEDNSRPGGKGGANERRAVHRNDNVDAPAAKSSSNLKDLVEIKSSAPAENWMMGVHGLKVTLTNRSTERLKNAAVEVRYYNEQNEVLEKRTINFSNVAPQNSATMPAPDHRLADHADFRLLTASN